MKRHPALHPLSHHYHHALAAAKRLKMAGIQHKGYRLEDVMNFSPDSSLISVSPDRTE